MFKTMKLGTKIALGFGCLIAIALLLGGLSVWRMNDVEQQSAMLAREYVPEVVVANGLERGSLLTMYEMRGYGLSQDEAYLTRGREHLAEVEQSLTDAKALAERSPHLVKLKAKVDEVRAKVDEYEALVEQTVARNKAIAENRATLDTAAAAYMENCADFLAHQNEMMQEELQGGGAESGHGHFAGRHAGEATAGSTSRRRAPVTARPCPAADEVLAELTAGNQRYVTGELARPNLDQERRTQTASHGQHPRVTILACSDSRVPVESIFDQGVGDVFPIRVAGNVCGTNELASIEYGVDHLATPLLVILGHTRCGAVTAAATGAEVHGSIPALLDGIQPVVERVKASHSRLRGDGLIEACVTENVWQAVEQVLTRSRAVQDRAKAGKVRVVGAIYDISEGTVEWLGTHPRQADLLAVHVQEPSHDRAHASSATVDAARGLERLEKITLVNDIIDLGNATRVACLKSQALRDPELIRGAGGNFDKIKAKFEALRSITRLDEDIRRIDRTEVAAEQYQTAMNELLENWLAVNELGTRRNDAAERVLQGAQVTAQAGLDHTTAIANGAMDSLSTASKVMLVGLAVALGTGCLLAFFITRGITRPINRIITGLNEGADQVNDAAAQVSGASQQLAEGASEQAASLEETSSSLEQMAAMTRTNAENAKQANQFSTQARSAAETGDQTMGRLNDAMAAINESSGQISKIIKVIEEIAFQTNLLALNAAVEAARAGEHGKGFAVVADEVRNLAQRCAQAARETTGLIEDSVVKAREGTNVAGEVGNALGAIVTDVAKVTELINGITQASQEQAQGVDQVNTAVSQMDKVTQQNASGAEESASAAEELSAQAQAVKGIVDELAALVGGAGRKSGVHPPVARKPASVPKAPRGGRPAVPAAARAQDPNPEFVALQESDEPHDF